MKDKINPTGRVRTQIYNRAGELIHDETGSNLVVTIGREALAELIVSAPSTLVVDKMSFGESGLAPALSNSVIFHATDKAIDSATTVGSTTTFVGTLDYGDAIGDTIKEYGLKCNNGSLFARYTWGGQVDKTALNRIVVTWSITF